MDGLSKKEALIQTIMAVHKVNREQAEATVEEAIRDPEAFKQRQKVIEQIRSATPKIKGLQLRRLGKPVGRNAPCTCGSGKKYKRCCGLDASPNVGVIVHTEKDEDEASDAT